MAPFHLGNVHLLQDLSGLRHESTRSPQVVHTSYTSGTAQNPNILWCGSLCPYQMLCFPVDAAGAS